MKKNGVLLAVLVSSLMLSGCAKSPYEEAIENTLSLLKEVTEIMTTIKDVPSANAAYSKLEIVKVKMEKLDGSMKGIKPPTMSEMRDIQEKYNSEMQQVLTEYGSEMMRVMTIPGIGAEMGETLANLTPSSG